MRDFLGEPDPNKVIENGYTLKGVLDALSKDQERQIAFVFTAYDLYDATIQEKYGTVERFIEEELPYLHNAHIDNKPVKCFPVAAVAQTEVITKSDGGARRVPALNFTSKGLDPLIDWLADVMVADIQKQVEEETARITQIEGQIQQDNWQRWQEEIALRKEQKWQKIKNGVASFFQGVTSFIQGILWFVIGGVIVIFVVIPFIQGFREGIQEKAVPTKPIPTVGERQYSYACDEGIWDCWSHAFSVTGAIRNDGAAGNIRITAMLGKKDQNGNFIPTDQQHKDEFFNAGQTKTITIKIPMSQCPQKIEGSYDMKATVP